MSASPPSASLALGQLAPGLGAVCGDYLTSYREAVSKGAQTPSGGYAAAQKFSRALDGLLGALYCAATAAAADRGVRPRGRVALVGVGGFGRGTVALHSDIDVLFLCDDPADPHVALVAEGLLYPLWDLGLSIGHAVRGVGETLELARTDVRTATTLLDVRRVAGDGEIVRELLARSRTHVFEPTLAAFIASLSAGMADRHERYGGSLHLLEPEVKMGRGGVRDVDVAVWAAQARWNCRTVTEFVQSGALLAREVEELEEARDFLWTVRNGLHLRAGRRQDRLTFEDQEELAPRLGFADAEMLGVERFMQAYYRHAQIVAQTAERMLSRAAVRPRPKRASTTDHGDGTATFDGHVTLLDSQALERDPALALRLYEQVVRTQLPPYPFARDAIARTAVDRAWCERLRADRRAAESFLALLCHHAGAPVRRGSILGELHELGLLLAIIPEFEPLTGRVQHDVYHVYTVDVHSVAAVDRLHELVRGDAKHEYPLACRLAAEVPRPVPLFLGVLLHDIGKSRGKDHSEKGAQMVGPIAERLGLSELDAAHVEWLVREHLSLYHWATRRDTTDPETLDEIARAVTTTERLRDLYLLTFADLSTTNPQAMTTWKARMFEDLYLRVGERLEGGRASEDRATLLREELEQGFSSHPRHADLSAFLRSMPDRYVLAAPPGAVTEHAELALSRGDRDVVVRTSARPDGEAIEVIVVTDDRPRLLADVALVLSAHRLSVVSAEVYGRSRPGAADEVFDVFLVRPPAGARAEGAGLGAKIEGDLRALWGGTLTVASLAARFPKAPLWAQRRTPSVRTEVVVDNGVSRQFTVVDVFTRDRIGLLHDIARTLHDAGVSIALSKVSTEGDRALDVFYVVDAKGSKIEEPARVEALTAALRALLGADAPEVGATP